MGKFLYSVCKTVFALSFHTILYVSTSISATHIFTQMKSNSMPSSSTSSWWCSLVLKWGFSVMVPSPSVTFFLYQRKPIAHWLKSGFLLSIRRTLAILLFFSFIYSTPKLVKKDWWQSCTLFLYSESKWKAIPMGSLSLCLFIFHVSLVWTGHSLALWTWSCNRS